MNLKGVLWSPYYYFFPNICVLLVNVIFTLNIYYLFSILLKPPFTLFLFSETKYKMKRKFPYDNHDDSEEKRGRPYSNGSVSDGNNAIHPQVANQIKSSTRIAFVIRKNKKHKHFGKKIFFPLKKSKICS